MNARGAEDRGNISQACENFTTHKDKDEEKSSKSERKSLLSLKFRDPEEEKAFQLMYKEKGRRVLKVCSALLILLAVILIFQTKPNRYMSQEIWRFCVGLVLTINLTFFSVVHSNLWNKLKIDINHFTSLVISVNAFVTSYFSITSKEFPDVSLPFILMSYTAIRLQLAQAIFIGTSTVVLYNFLILYKYGIRIDSMGLLHLNMQFVFSNMIGMLNAYILESRERAHFLKLYSYKKDCSLVHFEKRKLDYLLSAAIPSQFIKNLPEKRTAEKYESASVAFIHFKNVITYLDESENQKSLELLNILFKICEARVQQFGCEKVKTIDDTFMVVCGAPDERKEHASVLADAILLIIKDFNAFKESSDFQKKYPGLKLEIGVGMSSGPIIAGIIGIKRFCWDVWGDTVNIAARMENPKSSESESLFRISESTYQYLKSSHECIKMNDIYVKGKGYMNSYNLKRRSSHMENEQLRSDYLHEPPVYSEISLGDFLHSYDIEVGDIHDSIHLKEQQYLKNITDLRSISIIIIFMYCLSGLTYLLSAKGVPRILILFRFCIAFPVWMIHIFSTFSKKYSYKIGEIVSIICLASLFIGTILIQVHIFNMKYTTLYFDEAISHFYWVSFLSYAFLTVTPLSSRIYITLVFFVFASFSLCAVSKLLKGTLNEVVLFYFATCTLLVNLWVSNELSNLNFRNYALEIKVEQRRNELKEKRNTVKKVLENIIPLPYLPQMSQADQKLDLRGIHKHHNEVAVIVADVVNFTFLSQKVGRILLISLLHELFCRFDILAEKYGLEKVKTVGDWYLCCSGLFDSCPKQNRRENYSMKLKKFESSILMALDMHEEVASLNRTYSNQVSISIRIGIHYGRVISGVIGNSKFQFDVIGEAVSVASMLENSGKEWFVHISKEFEKEISHLKCFSELFIMDGSGFEYQSTKYASVLICRKRWMDDSNNPSLVGIDYHEHVDHLSRCLDIYYIE